MLLRSCSMLTQRRPGSMSDIPEKAVEAALQAVTESGLNAWVTTEGMRAALAAALPHLASAQPQPSESDIRDIAAWVNSLPSDADIRVEARAAALGECEAILRGMADDCNRIG